MKMLPAMTRTQSLKSAPVGTLGPASGAVSSTTLATSGCVIIAVSPLVLWLSDGCLLWSSDGSYLPSLCSVRGDSTPQSERIGLVESGIPRTVPGNGGRGAALVIVSRVDLPGLQVAQFDDTVEAVDRGAGRRHRLH